MPRNFKHDEIVAIRALAKEVFDEEIKKQGKVSATSIGNVLNDAIKKPKKPSPKKLGA